MLPKVFTAFRPPRLTVELPPNKPKLKILCSECDSPNLVDTSSAQSREMSAVGSQLTVSCSSLLLLQHGGGWTRSL